MQYSYLQLKDEFTAKLESKRRRRFFWDKIKKNTTLLVFASNNFFNDSVLTNTTGSFLGVPSRELSKIHAYYIVMPDKIVELNKQPNVFTPTLFKPTPYKSLQESLAAINYSYNQCYCNLDQPIPADEPRCSNITECRAGVDRGENYYCESVRVI